RGPRSRSAGAGRAPASTGGGHQRARGECQADRGADQHDGGPILASLVLMPSRWFFATVVAECATWLAKKPPRESSQRPISGPSGHAGDVSAVVISAGRRAALVLLVPVLAAAACSGASQRRTASVLTPSPPASPAPSGSSAAPMLPSTPTLTPTPTTTAPTSPPRLTPTPTPARPAAAPTA